MTAAPDTVDLEAAAWVERMARPVQDARSLALFDAWIDADPRHAERYGALHSLYASRELADAMAMPAANDTHGSPWRRPMVLASTIVACIGASLCLVPQFEHQHVTAAAGPPRTVTLADGSRVVLAGNSELDVRMTPWRRQADLVRGQAFFDVAHERTRPFEVAAGNTKARVLGTAFDIDRAPDGSTTLRVYRGAVSFGRPEGARWVVRAGEGALSTPFGLTRQPPLAATTPEWLARWLEVDDAPLAEVVAQLNRFSTSPIRLATPGIGNWRTSGRFDLHRPQRALDALALGMGLEWRKDDSGYRLTAAKEPR